MNKKIIFLIIIIIVLFLAGGLAVYSLFHHKDSNQSYNIVYNVLSNEHSKLIQAENKWIFYIAKDGKRYVFPNQGTFKSWFGDYTLIRQISNDELYKIPLGGNVFYRPGSKILQTPSDPKYYFVNLNGVLSPFNSESTIKEVYGADWKSQVEEIENYYFTNYRIGTEIKSIKDLPSISENITIDQNNF